MRKLTLRNAHWIREFIRASVKTPCDPHFLHRLHCVLLIAEGRSCYEVARWFGGDPRTVERWVHALELHGIEGLREHHTGGRPARLTGDEAQRLALELRKPPRISGYPGGGSAMERQAFGLASGEQLWHRAEPAPVPAHAASD